MATFRGWPDSRRDPAPMQGPGGWPEVGNLAGAPAVARRLNLRHPMARGLVGWWPLDEGQGIRARDLSPYANAGVLTNMAAPALATSGWGAGISQRELAWDGTDDIVSVPHAAQLALTGDMSISAWINATSVANYRSIVIKGNAGAGYPAPFHLSVEATTRKVLFYFGNGSSQTGIDVPSVTLGTPTHVCATRSGSTITVYLNGAYALSGNLGAQAVSDAGTALGIGARMPGTAYPMLGTVAHVRLYNRALSAAEAAQLYADKWIGAY